MSLRCEEKRLMRELRESVQIGICDMADEARVRGPEMGFKRYGATLGSDRVVPLVVARFAGAGRGLLDSKGGRAVLFLRSARFRDSATTLGMAVSEPASNTKGQKKLWYR